MCTTHPRPASGTIQWSTEAPTTASMPLAFHATWAGIMPCLPTQEGKANLLLFFFISLLYLYMHRSGKVSNSRNKIRQTCAPRLLAEPCMYTFIMPFHTTLPWHVILVHSFTLERLYGERKRVCVQSSKSNSNPTKRELLQCGSLRSAYYISPIQVGRLSIYDVRIELWSEVRHRDRGHPKRP